MCGKSVERAHAVSSRTAAVGETFACSSPAYGTVITSISVDLAKISHRRTNLPSRSEPRSTISAFHFGTSLVLTLLNTDCRPFDTVLSLNLPVESTSSQVLSRKHGYAHYTPVHRTTGPGLHLARLVILPRWSWRTDAAL